VQISYVDKIIGLEAAPLLDSMYKVRMSSLLTHLHLTPHIIDLGLRFDCVDISGPATS